MKRAMLSLILFLTLSIPCLVVVTPGCKSQSAVTYKTLYSLEVATTGAFDSYCGLVIQHKLPTNDVPRISRDYNLFQTGMQLAIAAARGNSNAPPPASLVTQSTALLNTIATATKGTP